MNESIFTRTFYFCFLASIVLCLFLYFKRTYINETVVVFCDVGQGDAAYIRVENKVDILIDAGPDNKVLSCLGKYMPFWDHTIELAFLSHPQKDHYGGYLTILDHYKIGQFFETHIPTKSSLYDSLEKKLTEENVPTSPLYQNDQLIIGNAEIDSLWPGKSNVLAFSQAKNDPNIISQVFVFSYKNTRILFTGDIYGRLVENIIPNVDIMKTPHHGSANGLTAKMLKLADPFVAVISVGKNNVYGHPSKKVLDMLQASDLKKRRTDQEGDIVFKL